MFSSQSLQSETAAPVSVTVAFQSNVLADALTDNASKIDARASVAFIAASRKKIGKAN
jgi:hypothetical protein